MARPNKQGVDYFPLDVHLDDKFKFIEIKFKLEGFAILIKLMQRVYSNGYWCKWTDDEVLLFSDEIKADYHFVVNVVDECLKRGVFDNIMYTNFEILTSKGIQKRYKEIVRRRKDVEVISDYLLIDGNFGVNDDINPAQSKRIDGKSTQSKVKESKVNKTEIETTTTAAENAFSFYENNFGILSPFMADDIDYWMDRLPEIVVVEAMKIAKRQNKNWHYATGILKDWDNHNLRTLPDIEAHQKTFKRTKNNPIPGKSIFSQGEESKKRQAESKPIYTDQELAEIIKDLPY